MGRQPVLPCHRYLTLVGDRISAIGYYNAGFVTYKGEIVVTVKYWVVSYGTQKMFQDLKDTLQTLETSQNIISIILWYLKTLWKILKKSGFLLILGTFPL